MNYYNYFTEIEDHFVRRRGKHMYVSPMDWHLIETWRSSGIPLHIALRGIDIAMDTFFARRSGGAAKINTLAYCHDSVMAEYARHLESHLGEDPAGLQHESADARHNAGSEHGEPDKKRIIEFIKERISEIGRLEAKQYCEENASLGLGRVLRRMEEVAAHLEAGDETDIEALERDLAILDELLVAELLARVPAAQLSEWEKEAKKDLKIYRKRLPKETYKRIREGFLRGKVHQWFHVGELSLFHL